MNKSSNAFTLIELLIVVAIIAILSAFAVPNFLNAQTRAKISRTKGDMRSIASAIESYHVDYHAYPPGYNPLSISGLNVLTTPIAFLTSSSILDPFSSPGLPESKRLLTYELVNSQGKIIEAGGGMYSVYPDLPQGESIKGVGWWLAGRGPDKAFGFKTVNPEYDIRKRYYESDTFPEPFLDTVYDPTNGTGSIGNIYRAGGSPVNFAQRYMSCH
jgi:prepilin-type N-terminal cleavage/methylation domain-containing protein